MIVSIPSCLRGESFVAKNLCGLGALCGEKGGSLPKRRKGDAACSRHPREEEQEATTASISAPGARQAQIATAPSFFLAFFLRLRILSNAVRVAGECAHERETQSRDVATAPPP
jgi:hypothetical protein